MREKAKLIGLDEAGRGPLAGPVVAVAVCIDKKREKDFLMLKKLGIKDSKKILPKKREMIYEEIISFPFVEWGMGIVSEKTIDKINILEATKLAMKKALKKVNREDYLLIIDGNFKINTNQKQKSITRADTKILECSIASIIAKVERDKIMQKYHKKYPIYGFDKHKGYGTREHYQAIKKYGLCKIHRKSFNLKID